MILSYIVLYNYNLTTYVAKAAGFLDLSELHQYHVFSMVGREGVGGWWEAESGSIGTGRVVVSSIKHRNSHSSHVRQQFDTVCSLNAPCQHHIYTL